MGILQRMLDDTNVLLSDDKFREYLQEELVLLRKKVYDTKQLKESVPEYVKNISGRSQERLVEEYKLILAKKSDFGSAKQRLALIQLFHKAINKTLHYYGKQKNSNHLPHEPEAGV